MFNHLRPKYVIHCAAKVGGVKANRDNPVDFLEQNVTINSNVIVACHVFGIKKLVNIGTSCMFPKDAPTPVRESSYMTGPLEPSVESYAMAKMLAFATCNAYRSQHGCDFVTTTPCNLYGPNDNYGPSSHVIPALIRSAFEARKSGKPMKVWGDGSATREFLHSDDAASALKIILADWNLPELINIGSGHGTTIKELASLIANIVGVNEVEWVKTEPTGIQNKTFDISKITWLGWRPKISLEDGLAQACKDYEFSTNVRFK